MNKALMIVMVLAIVTVGAFAGDYHVGVNLKGYEGEGTVQPAVEFGYTDDYLGMYAQVGAIQKQALLGLALTLPKTPVQIYGGAGVKAVGVTSYTTYQVVTDVETGVETTVATEVETTTNLGWWNLHGNGTGEGTGSGTGVGSGTGAITVSDNMTAIVPFFEAGIGLDMGPILTKVGWTNLNGNALSFTMAASF